jgi:hypothetical protein
MDLWQERMGGKIKGMEEYFPEKKNENESEEDEDEDAA